MDDNDCIGLIICCLIIVAIIGTISIIEYSLPNPKEIKTLQKIDCAQLKTHISDLIIADNLKDEMRAEDLYHWRCN